MDESHLMQQSHLRYRPHMTHWGGFEALSDGQRLTDVRPLVDDPDPSPLIHNVASAQHAPERIDQPYVRAGWYRDGPGAPGRGSQEFVPVSWDTAIDLLAGELKRVYTDHGAASVYGGSYGWASAGRFHHSQSQLHRFLNCLGGFTYGVTNYSYGTSEVLLPHIVADSDEVMRGATSWQNIAEHTELLVAFGGLPGKNAAVTSGGIRRHSIGPSIADAHRRGTRFVSVSPLRDDTRPEAQARWLPIRPGSDAALMLAIAYVLIDEDLLDREFLATHTRGFEEFEAYLLGRGDGIAKDPAWAQDITEVPAADISGLARDMARHRTMLTVSWSIQRNQHGEQPVWLAIVLAAMLGQIGMPGGGFGHGYSSSGYIGRQRPAVQLPAVPQGHNPVSQFIPVARISDMLLNPGASYRFNGRTHTYPHIKLVYWCGGNPFHHHQDLARLRAAFQCPDTVVVHDPFWTATARHADIVLPATMSVERNDFAAGKNEHIVTAMPRLTEPAGRARNDFDIFADLSRTLGVEDEFTAGREETDWLRHLYRELTERVAAHDAEWPVPDFDEFWRTGRLELPQTAGDQVLFGRFAADPESNPLPTASGRIEVFSPSIADSGAIPGHPVWIQPDEWPGNPSYPLTLLANQPRSRLHSQLDGGAHSQADKVAGREALRMNPRDASARGLSAGDLVLVSSPRGRCLAGLRISDDVSPGVTQLSTGAWYNPDPDDPAFCRNGNVNVLTADRPTSPLTQSCAGGHVMVEVARAHL